MANTLDLTNLTLEAEVITEASQIMFRNAFADTNITEYHDIQQGIVNDRYVGFLTPDLIIGKEPGPCGVGQESAVSLPSQVKWEPKKTAGKSFLCADELASEQVKFTGSKYGQTIEETTEFDRLVKIVSDKIVDEIGRSIFLKAWLGEKLAAHAPTGKFSPTFDLDFINQNDGLLLQTLSLPASQRLSISENGALTTAGQVLSPARALEIVEELYTTKATEYLKSKNAKIIYVSRSVFEGLRLMSANNANTLIYGLRIDVSQGQNVRIYYWDTEVKVMSPQTQFIYSAKSYNIGGQDLYGDPHFAVLTTKENIPLGLGSIGTLDFLDIIWVPQERRYHILWNVMYDCKIMDQNLIAVAYV